MIAVAVFGWAANGPQWLPFLLCFQDATRVSRHGSSFSPFSSACFSGKLRADKPQCLISSGKSSRTRAN